MADQDLGITEQENLQIEALKRGATEEEASLGGRLGTVRRVPVEEAPAGAAEPTGELKSSARMQRIKDITREPVRGISLLDTVKNTSEGLSEADMKQKATELALIKTSIDPLTSPEDAYRESFRQMRTSPDTDALFESYQQEYAGVQKSRVLDVMVAKTNSGETSPEEAAELIQDANDIGEAYSGKAGKERLLVEAYADGSFEQQDIDNQAAHNYAWSKYQELSESKSFGQKTLSFLGLMFVPDFIKDVNDLTGNDLFDTKKDILNLVASYQSLPPSQKPEAFDVIFERAREAFEDNTFKMAGLVNMLHSPDPESEFNIGAVGDIVDIALTASGPLAWAGKTAKGASNGTKTVKKMRSIGADDEAATLVNLRQGKEIDNPSDVVVGDQLDAAISASPYRMEDYLVGIDSTDGVALRVRQLKDENMRRIAADVRDDVQRPFEEIRDADFRVSVSALDNQEKEKAVGIFAEKMANRFDADDLAYEAVGPKRITDKGFEFEYKINGEPRTETVRFTQNDIGTFDGVNDGFVKSFIRNNALFSKILSPEVKLNNVSNVTGEVTFGGLQASRLKRELTIIAKNLDKGMSKKERRGVSELLIAGDEEGKVFSYNQLRNKGVELKSGYRTYSDKEIGNYYKKVAFNQELWALRNHTVKNELEFMGARSVRYKAPGSDTDMKEFVGIPKENFRGVQLADDAPILAPQLNEAGIVNRGMIDTTKLTEEGYKPVQLVEPFMVNNKKVEYAIIKDEGKSGRAMIDQLPDEVLHRIPGYVPRMYEPGYYFVKDINSGKTIRAFEHRAKAEKFKAAQMEEIRNMSPEELKAKGLEKDVNMQVFRDRELNKQEALMEDANLYGGLYTGARKKDPLLLNEGIDAQGNPLRPARLSWGASTQRYIDSVGDLMPLNEYRMALKQRFINSVNKLAEMEGKPALITPDTDWKNVKINLDDPRTSRMMEDMRDYMKSQFAMWSDQEKGFNGFMMDIAEMMSNKSPWLERKIAHNFSHSDPLRSLHTASFHAHLGWFNLRQLYVQAQNSALAISMHPIEGLKGATKAAAMQAFMRLPDDQMVAAINKVGKIPGVDSLELIDDIRTFKRSGMESSIRRVADYDAAADGLTPGTFDRIRNLSRKGLIFYEQGELFSRMVAWNIAKANWKKLNKGRAIDDDAIKDITQETFRLHMNLQRENAATWQQNLLRLPTQFLQVQAKLAEKIIPAVLYGRTGPTGWTRGEASRVLAGQMILYGTLGVPIAEQAMNRLGDMTGKSVKEIQEESPLFAEAVQDGALGTMFEALGFQNQFGGDTASLMAGIDDNVVAGLLEGIGALVSGEYGTDTLGELALGPSLNVMRRTGDAVIDTTTALRSVFYFPTPENIGSNILGITDDWAAITSTWSNARKARWLHSQGKLFSKSGEILVDERNIEGLNLRTIFARAMGMPLDMEASYWALKKSNRDITQDLGSIKSDWKKALRQYYLDENLANLKTKQLLLFGDPEDSNYLSPIERKEIMEESISEIISEHKKSDLDRELEKYLKLHIRGQGRHPARQSTSNIFQAEDRKQQQETEQ